MSSVIVYRNEVSHRWRQRTLLRFFDEGKVTRDAICDADFLLLTAAVYHGQPVGRACPVCESDELREVRWIYGDQLGRRSGTARSDEEIARIATEKPGLTVHLVEVCTRCKWNHLLNSATAEGA